MFFADPSSFVFVTAVVGAVVACMLLLAHAGVGGDTTAVAWWVAGDVSLTVYRALLLAQPGSFGAGYTGIPGFDGSSVFPVTTPFVVLGVACHVLATGLMAGRRWPPSTAVLAVLATPLVYTLLAAPQHGLSERILVLACCMTVLTVMQAAVVWPLVRRSRGAMVLLLTNVVLVLSNIGTVVAWLAGALVLPEPRAGVPDFPPVHGLLMDFIASLFMTFSFVLLVQERVREHIVRLSNTDRLTGALNRHGMHPVLEQECRRASRYGRPLAVALLDLDHFKRINDVCGHAGGDAVLVAFTQHMQGLIRNVDRLARWGGEEFLLVMPETTTAEAGRAIDRMRSAIESTPLVPGLPRVTVSAGVAAIDPEDGETDIDTLLARADRRLYAAKQLRNCVVDGDDTLTVGSPATAGLA